MERSREVFVVGKIKAFLCELGDNSLEKGIGFQKAPKKNIMIAQMMKIKNRKDKTQYMDGRIDLHEKQDN